MIPERPALSCRYEADHQWLRAAAGQQDGHLSLKHTDDDDEQEEENGHCTSGDAETFL